MLEHPEKETLIEERLTSEVLRLLKESEDRGLGTARQSVDVTTNGENINAKRELTEAEVIEEMKRRGLPIPKDD